jgi:RHS repeat-associated protein
VTGSFGYNAWGEKLLDQPPPEGSRFVFSAPAWMMLKDDPDGRYAITPTRTCDLATGRFLQKDSAAKDGANPYVYVRNNPTKGVDPSGLDGRASGLGPGEWHIDPKDPGTGIATGPNAYYTRNCFAFAWGQQTGISFPKALDFVPSGCKEVQCEKNLDRYNCAAKNEVVVVVSYGKDAKGGAVAPMHMIFRDPSIGAGYSTKLGGAGTGSEEVQNCGSYVRGITDVAGHFKWYYDAPSLKDEPEFKRRCFICQRDKMTVAAGQVS